MKRYDVLVRYPDRFLRKNRKAHLITPPMASREHALWYAACSVVCEYGTTEAHVTALPVSIEVTEIPE